MSTEEQEQQKKLDWKTIIPQSIFVILVIGMAIKFLQSERQYEIKSSALIEKLDQQADLIYNSQKAIDEFINQSNNRIQEDQDQITIIEKQQPIITKQYYEKIVTLRPDSTIEFAFDTSRTGFYRDYNKRHEIYFPTAK